MKQFKVREMTLKSNIGRQCHFVAKIGRDSYENPSVMFTSKTLLAPLFIQVDDKFTYIDHVWLELPKFLKQKKGSIIEFEGTVYPYRKSCGEMSVGISFVDFTHLVPETPVYKNLKMLQAEVTDGSNNKRRKINNNFTIINAYENGVNLKSITTDKKKKSKKKKKKH